jgi:soluble lytic murein transglycosylase-like protein
VESRGNASAIGSKGEVGLMQVMPGPKRRKGPLLLPRHNIMEGTKLLRNAANSCKHRDGFTFLVCYNRGVAGGAKVERPYKDAYYRRVMNELQKRSTSAHSTTP